VQDEEPIKDADAAHPIASAWRPTLREIVKAIAEGDYSLSRGIRGVAPVSDAIADQMRVYVSHYGETLTDLPDDTWNTSVSQWMGAEWEVLVDLWTIESGASDLVLTLRVLETDDGFLFEIDSIHVP
jgi:hypothetical protein